MYINFTFLRFFFLILDRIGYLSIFGSRRNQKHLVDQFLNTEKHNQMKQRFGSESNYFRALCIPTGESSLKRKRNIYKEIITHYSETFQVSYWFDHTI